jgi:rusticyanin
MNTKMVLAGTLLFSFAQAVMAAPGVGMRLVGAQPMTLTLAQAAAAEKTTAHGIVSTDKKTLTFHQRLVRLVVRSGPANDMLSYRIDGLRNPTLIVPAGATLKTLFINTDDDMTHNLRLTVQKMPFKGTMKSVGTGELPHVSGTAFHAEELTFRLPKAGTYIYLCTIPGHAPRGMFGTLIVR